MTSFDLNGSKPVDHIWAWVAGYAPNKRVWKPLAFLQAYIDDSGSEDGERHLYMAGYLHTAEAWSLFSETWQEALEQDPSIEYLKMSEANSLRGEFSGWSEAARDNKIFLLTTVIKYFEPVSFHVSVSRKLFSEHITPNAPYALKSPHFLCVSSIMAVVAKYIDSLPEKVPVDFIFDRQEGVQFDISLFFEQLIGGLSKSEKSLIAKTPVFADDKEFLPLQAADLLAWHLRKQDGALGEAQGNLADLLGREHFSSEFDEERLEILGRGFARETQKFRPQSKSDWRRMKRNITELLADGFIPPMGTKWKNFRYHLTQKLRNGFKW